MHEEQRCLLNRLGALGKRVREDYVDTMYEIEEMRAALVLVTAQLVASSESSVSSVSSVSSESSVSSVSDSGFLQNRIIAEASELSDSSDSEVWRPERRLPGLPPPVHPEIELLRATPPRPPQHTRQCTICREDGDCPVLVPCGHRFVCVACVPGLRYTCPLCRRGFTTSVLVYE